MSNSQVVISTVLFAVLLFVMCGDATAAYTKVITLSLPNITGAPDNILNIKLGNNSVIILNQDFSVYKAPESTMSVNSAWQQQYEDQYASYGQPGASTTTTGFCLLDNSNPSYPVKCKPSGSSTYNVYIRPPLMSTGAEIVSLSIKGDGGPGNMVVTDNYGYVHYYGLNGLWSIICSPSTTSPFAIYVAMADDGSIHILASTGKTYLLNSVTGAWDIKSSLVLSKLTAGRTKDELVGVTSSGTVYKYNASTGQFVSTGEGGASDATIRGDKILIAKGVDIWSS